MSAVIEAVPCVGNGEGFGVLLGLVAGAEHGFVPAGGAADAGAAAAGGFEEGGGVGDRAALLSFEDKASALIEIDEAGAGKAVGVA